MGEVLEVWERYDIHHMTYDYDRAAELAEKKPKKFKLETNLLGKKMAEHLAKGYKLIN